MKGFSCFLFGNHDAPPDILPELEHAIEKHIAEYGVTSFTVGHYGSFDRMAAAALLLAKEIHLQIELVLLSPYHPAERTVTVPDGFDRIIYPFLTPPPRKYAIAAANRYAVDHTDYIISCRRFPIGNTGKLLEYAHNRRHLKGITFVGHGE